jgi:hypothetical protein
MHLDMLFPTNIGNGARRTGHWEVEIVKTDGGNEVCNSRWSEPLWTFDVPLPVYTSDSAADFVAVRDLWMAAQGAANTFNFWDDLEQSYRKVRFSEDLQIEDVVGPYRQLDSIVLQEVRG